MEGKYHQGLHETLRDYEEQIEAGTNQENLLKWAYIRLAQAQGFGELTPWDREAHARVLELLAGERKRTLEKAYKQKTLGWLTGRGLRKEMKTIDYITKYCRHQQKEALEDMSRR